MTPPNVRTFYAALGIELPAWAKREAPVRCFAQPDAHNRGDRSPSCSVNLASGAWNCHGCGAHGGAYDAALATGRTPRSAMDLLIGHCLGAPRTTDHQGTERMARRSRSPTAVPGPVRPSALNADEDDVQRWAEMLDADSRLVRRLMLDRAWGSRAIRELGLGFDGARITIPVRNAHGRLRGLLRYDPIGRRDPKMLAVLGTRLGLVPHPASEQSERILLVEGPPDMIAARSCGLAAIAIPGTSAWQPSWAQLLAGKRVTIVMDCDAPGRRAAHAIAKSLDETAKAVEVVDIWPDRHDGYDLTDRILERRRSRSVPSPPRTIASLLRPARWNPLTEVSG
jgi:Toprim-like